MATSSYMIFRYSYFTDNLVIYCECLDDKLNNISPLSHFKKVLFQDVKKVQ